MSTRTIAELAAVNFDHFETFDKSYDDEENELIYEKIPQQSIKFDTSYQRFISPAAVKKGGRLSFNKLNPITICRRPTHLEEDSGDFCVDGQHRSLRAYFSNYDGDLPSVVHTHPDDFTLAKCREYEASLFKKLNTLQKKTTGLDNVRAGIIAGDKQDIHILSVMKTLNVVNDNFGSEKDDNRLIHPFSHFLHAVTTDYKDDWNPLVDGLALLDEVFPNKTEVNAYGLRAFALLTEFYGLLNEKKSKAFQHYVEFELNKAVRTVRQLISGHTAYNSPRWVLYDVLKRYNDWNTDRSLAIGEKTLNSISVGNKRFADPS